MRPRATWAEKGLLAALAGFVITMVGLFFSVETEDAYIFYRYAANLIHHGQFVYNLGDRVWAFTSPLYALVVVLLNLVFSDLFLATKVFGLGCFIVSVAVLARKSGLGTIGLIPCLIIVAGSPYLVMWTLGGLETPLLALLCTLFCVTTRSAQRSDRSLTHSSLVGLTIAGLALVTRYDALVFFSFGALALLLRLGKQRLGFGLFGLMFFPVCWLSFAYGYYGDVLPTSFYVKLFNTRSTLDLEIPFLVFAKLVYNGLYTFDFMLFSGTVVFAAVCSILIWLTKCGTGIWRSHWRAMWWAYLGIVGIALYGLWTATTHMFYSFRLFVPFLPAVGLVVGDLLERLSASDEQALQRARTLAAYACVFVLLLQGTSLVHSSNPLGNLAGARNGEFRWTGAKPMAHFVRMYAEPIETIREHWSSLAKGRSPRVYTFAAGILPYLLQDAYIYEALSSYRHRCKVSRKRLMQASDYVLLLSPRHGAVSAQLPSNRESFVELYEVSGLLDNVRERYLLFFNRDPEPVYLPPRVRSDCPQR